MNFKTVLFIFACVSLTGFVHQPKLSNRKPAQAEASLLPDAAVQSCLDKLRKKALTNQAVDQVVAAADPIIATASPFTFHQISADALPLTCPTGDLATLKIALQRQIENCTKAASGALTDTKDFACRTYTRREWCLDVNVKMLEIANGSKNFVEFEQAIARQFDWYQSDGKIQNSDDGQFKKGDVQFTAYDSPPPIAASLTQTQEFSYPIYRAPPELVHLGTNDARTCGNDPVTANKVRWCARNTDGSLSPLPDRRAIDADGALKNRGLEIAYVHDPVDVAFVMVEGSGSLRFFSVDGKQSVERLNFDALNGRPSQMLGRILKCEGAKPADYSSEPGIRKFLASHANDLARIMNFDQSYVFFKTSTTGPYGIDGVAIVPYHSLATDRSVIPAGSVSLFRTLNPKRGEACHDVTSVGISQDTGGAIIGAHVDWYLGETAEAQVEAGNFNEPGSIYVALPNGGGSPTPGCTGHVSSFRHR